MENMKICPNQLVKIIGKPSKEFTKADIIKYIKAETVEIVNFRYVAGDGRLKTLNFVINSLEHLDNILSLGERVDGSSLFPHIEAGSSDLYVVPRFSTAFINPVSKIPSIDFLCSYFNKDGEPLDISPEYILRKAHKTLTEKTGYTFEVMGELEYYVINESESLFEATDQRGYHESYPFNKMEEFRNEAMRAIAKAGGLIKYGHSEVGNFSLNGKIYEQNEIEFLPTTLEDAADQLVIAKWILRALANQYGITLTFAPKITTGKAGSGLHIHTRLMKNGKSVMLDNGKLSDTAKKAIAGFMDLAPSLTAFGNTNPTSYFRLVPHQEAPTKICWGDRNRSVLVRVPLGWCGKAGDMMKIANPNEESLNVDISDKQTVEFRCPDGSADIYLLLAGLTVAARRGLEMDNALELAQKTYVDVNIFKAENANIADKLNQLPVSCVESAEMLLKQKDIYMQYDVFSKNMLEGIANKLSAYDDKGLINRINNNNDAILELVNKYFHCG